MPSRDANLPDNWSWADFERHYGRELPPAVEDAIADRVARMIALAAALEAVNAAAKACVDHDDPCPAEGFDNEDFIVTLRTPAQMDKIAEESVLESLED